MRKAYSIVLCLVLSLLALGSWAAVDPAASGVESLHSALVESMKAGSTSSAADRYKRLAPVIEKTFDLPVMTAFAVGPAWAHFLPSEQQAAIAAFTQLTVASYVHNFHSFGGEHFELDPNVSTRGVDKIVQTHLVSPNSGPVALMYRLRKSPPSASIPLASAPSASTPSWKIIDIYYGAISQLSTRRSDFAAPITAGGAQGLISHLHTLSDALMK